MSYAVYEVELEPIVEGQRFCQHIKAASPEDASAKVAAIQGRAVIGVSIWRECTQREIDELTAV